MANKIVNGEMIELTSEEEKSLHDNWLKNEQEQKKNKWLRERQEAYGSWQKQLEIINEKGIEAFQNYCNEVKGKFPKPTE
jgi:hypothetical protein